MEGKLHLGINKTSYMVSLHAQKLKWVGFGKYQDEDLLAEIARNTPGMLVIVRENMAGQINDAPTGEPAVQVFNNGKLISEAHYHHGVYHGKIRQFDDNGAVTHEENWHYGQQVQTKPAGPKKPKPPSL